MSFSTFSSNVVKCKRAHKKRNGTIKCIAKLDLLKITEYNSNECEIIIKTLELTGST